MDLHRLTFVDRTRHTPAEAGTTGSAVRTLETVVRVPRAPAGPLPLVVFCHGFRGHARKFSRLLDAWARRGFVVAAPVFPLSNYRVPGEPWFDDVPNQPGDVRFLLDELLRSSDEPTGPLVGRIDARRIGVAGMSMGAMTAYAVAFADPGADPRIRAVMAMAGRLYSPSGRWRMRPLPLMILHGDADDVVDPAHAREAYRTALAPKFHLEVRGGDHFRIFEDDLHPADDLVHRVTTAFWDRYLGDGTSADARLLGGIGLPGPGHVLISETD